jgi:hypothetical protein
MNRKPDISSFDPLAGPLRTNVFPPATTATSSQQPDMQQLPTQTPPVTATQQQIIFLDQHGISSGLANILLTAKAARTVKIVVIENSSAMNVRDSHRIGPHFENIACSRWEELNDCIAYHSQIAATFGIPTRFALLNDPKVGPQYFTVGEKDPVMELKVAQHVMTQHLPYGPAMITEELQKLKNYIVSCDSVLPPQATVTVVLATQGIPTSGGQAFVNTLRNLEGLRVWVIIRLCTDDEKVFDFYNTLDAQINLPYDVIDDFFGEALEVYLRNPWLTYGMPLHRIRELGFHIPVLDVIDERALTIDEVRDLCYVLFAKPLVDPSVDWRGFVQALANCMKQEKLQFNPVTRKVCPWINIHDLEKLYGPRVQPDFPCSKASHQGWQNDPAQQGFWQANPSSQQSRDFASTHVHQNQTHFYSSYSSASSSPQQLPKPQPNTFLNAGSDLSTAVTEWATIPPVHSTPHSVRYLLSSVQGLFPPAFGVQPHEHFAKWKPFSPEALQSQNPAVIQRGMYLMNQWKCIVCVMVSYRLIFLILGAQNSCTQDEVFLASG